MSMPDSPVHVVEDEAQTRISLEALLSSMGFAVRPFASAEQFLAALDGDVAGCALVDFRLPGLNGLELFHRLRAEGRQMPVILMSAFFNVRVAANALAQGVFGVLEKPYTHAELEDAVRRALQTDRLSRRNLTYRLDMEHRLRSLDDRQKLTLQLILAGQPNKTIERRLGVSRRTVERTRAAILEKMKAMSFVELAAALAETRQVSHFDITAQGTPRAHSDFSIDASTR